jgi:hypothetical protein
MLINLSLGYQYQEEKFAVNKFLELYGVHLSIILAFYFSQGEKEIKKVTNKFTLILLILFIIMWNGILMSITTSSRDNLDVFISQTTDFAVYGNFLVAGGIVWLFNGKTIIEKDW